MAAPMTAAMPPGRDLGGGYIVQLVALDASTGAVLTGLTVTNAVMVVENVGGGDLETVEPVAAEVLLPIAEGQDTVGSSA
jgi:hypothetical protein